MRWYEWENWNIAWLYWLPLPDDYVEDIEPIDIRHNEDKIVNTQGKRVIEICKMCNLRILNGRMGADSYRGRITCVTYNGQSVVDYVMCSPSLFQKIAYFEVLDQNEFSDHNPIQFGISDFRPPEVAETPKCFGKIRWESDKVELFKTALDDISVISKLNECMQVLGEVNMDVNDQVNSAVTHLTEAVRLAADKYFYHNINPHLTHSHRNKPRWADGEWQQRKKIFLRSLNNYKRHKSDTNRLKMVQNRKRYKEYCKQRYTQYERQQTSKLLAARVSNVKMYWRMLTGSNTTKKMPQINNNEYRDYFMQISDPGDEFFTADRDITERVQHLIQEDLVCAFEELNATITHKELDDSIKQLKTGKSGGDDGLLNEFFIYGRQRLAPYLIPLFNFVFEKGIFPETWSEGLLVPLHIMGNINIVHNYRGITLLSVLGKLFTRILNNRLTAWAESYGIYVEAQNGFRSGRGTTDTIFILHNVINKFIEEGKSLYALFIDFSKAFDFVVHNNLWFKLLDMGIGGKILNIIRSMYTSIKTRVFSNGIKSEVYYGSLGVKQGECLSPFLFSMYINDLQEYLVSESGGVTIGHIQMLLLLYADDVVVFAKSSSELQQEMDKLFNYCNKWKLKLNTTKSKLLFSGKVTLHHVNHGNLEMMI